MIFLLCFILSPYIFLGSIACAQKLGREIYVCKASARPRKIPIKFWVNIFSAARDMLAALFFSSVFLSVINIREVVFFAQPRVFFISLDFDARRGEWRVRVGVFEWTFTLLCVLCWLLIIKYLAYHQSREQCKRSFYLLSSFFAALAEQPSGGAKFTRFHQTSKNRVASGRCLGSALDAIDDEFCCAGSALGFDSIECIIIIRKRFLCAQFHAHTVCFIEGWARDIILWMKSPTSQRSFHFQLQVQFTTFAAHFFLLFAASFAVRPHYECSFRGNHNLIALRSLRDPNSFVQEAERHKQTWEMTDRRGSRWGCGSIGAEDRDAHEMMRMKEQIMRKKTRVKFLLTDRWEFIALEQLIVINASILSMHKFLLINLWLFIYVGLVQSVEISAREMAVVVLWPPFRLS